MQNPGKVSFPAILQAGEKKGDKIDFALLEGLRDYNLDLSFLDGSTEVDLILTEEFISLFGDNSKYEESQLMGRIVAFLIKASWFKTVSEYSKNPTRKLFEELDGFANQRFTDDTIIPELKYRFQEIFADEKINILIEQLLVEILEKAKTDHDKPDSVGTLYTRFINYLTEDIALNQLLKTRKI